MSKFYLINQIEYDKKDKRKEFYNRIYLEADSPADAHEFAKKLGFDLTNKKLYYSEIHYEPQESIEELINYIEKNLGGYWRINDGIAIYFKNGKKLEFKDPKRKYQVLLADFNNNYRENDIIYADSINEAIHEYCLQRNTLILPVNNNQICDLIFKNSVISKGFNLTLKSYNNEYAESFVKNTTKIRKRIEKEYNAKESYDFNILIPIGLLIILFGTILLDYILK